jgi:hypothetical protein
VVFGGRRVRRNSGGVGIDGTGPRSATRSSVGGRGRGRRKAFSWLGLAAAGVLVAPLLSSPSSPLGPSPAAAAPTTCTNTWTGTAGDNNWFTPGNWSSDAAPVSTDDVCIGPGMSTSTTVNLDEEGSVTIDSLTVGGGTGGTQTLAIGTSPVGGGGNNVLTLNSTTLQSGTLADGAIDLGSVSTASLSFAELTAATGAPTFSNAGHIVAESTGATVGQESDNRLNLDVTNTGTLEVAGNLGIGQIYGPSAPGPVTFTNDGTLTVDSGGYFEVEGSGSNTATLTDTGGTITNNGSFEVTDGIVTQAATTLTGTAIHLVGSALTFTGTGTGVWDFQATSNTVSGNMVTGQTIRLDGGTVAPFADEDYAELTVLGSNSWGGTVILDSNGVSTNYADLEGTGTQTITSGGVLETEGAATGDTTDRYLRGDIDVDGGSVDLAAANNVMDSDNGATTLTITAGNMTVEATAELNLSANDSYIDAEGGTLTDDGSLVLTGDGTFTENATDTSSSTQPILLVGGAGLVFTGPGKGLWDLQRSASLTGNMAAGQTVRVLGGTDTFPDGNAPEGDQSDADIHLEGSYNWGGTVILDSLDGQGLASIEAVGAEGTSAYTETITSGGQLLSEQGGGDTRQIDFNIINNGTIDLAADHTDNNENNVITNNATMTVEGQLLGDELDQTGDDENPVINNNGTLDLGANAQLNVFNLTESAAAHLGLTVDGNPASGDFSTIPVGTTTSLDGAGTISLAGILDLTLPGGYSSPTIGDTFPIVSASNVNRLPKVTGTFSTVNGAQITPSTAFTVAYTASSVSLVVEAHTAPGGPPVLAASNVSAPTAPNTSPSPGQPVSATFKVTNTGTGTAEGPWNDSVYVGTGSTYSPSDALLERIPQTTNVGPGDSYDVTVQAFLPPLPAGGNYQLFVVPDSGARVSVPSADTQAVSPAFVVSPPPDLGNGPVSTTVAAGQDLYVQVTVGDSADTKVSLNEPGVDLLASPGVFPTENSSTEQASGSSGNASLILPESTPGVWYIDLHGEDGAGAPPGESVTVTAAMVPLSVTHVEPTVGSIQASSSIIALQGSDFGSDTTVTLSNSGAQLAAYSVDVSNSTLLYASFQLDLIDAGVYDIVVTSHGQTTTLSKAFTVTNNSVNQVTVTATGPPSIRYGWSGNLDVTVTNVGDSDVTVPIIRVTADDLLGEVAPPGTVNWGRSAEVINPNFSSKDTGPLPPSVLPPGDSGTFAFFVAAIVDEGDTGMSYSAEAVTSADPNPIDWSAQLASSEPPDVSTATWTSVVNDIATQMGPTEGSYAAALPAVFAEAAGYGVTFTSEAQILNYLVRRAFATAPGAAVSGTLYLGNTSTPLSQTPVSLADGTGEPQYATTSWYNGQFDIWGVTPGTYELTAEGYTPHPAQQVVASPTASGLSVVVQTGATLSGKITNAATSEPVSGATVTATDSDGTLDSDVTGGNGTYQIAGLESGNVTVSASGPGLVPLSSATVAVAAPGTTPDNIALQPGATVSGTITIPGGGSPPAGTTVEALPTDGTLPDGTIDSQDGVIDSNGDGGYSIAGLAPGAYSIVAASPGLGDATLSVTVVGTTPITGQDLALTDAGAVTGVITDAATGLPIAGVSVSSDSLGTGGPVTTGTDGSYSLPDVSVGSVRITVTPPDDTHVAQVVPTTVTADGPNVVSVALAPAGTLSAVIEDGSGNPLDGVQVTVAGPTFTGATGGVKADVLTTDATGTATDTGLVPGSYDLQVQGSTVDHPFTITAALPDASFVVTVPVATLSGVVEDTGGNPVSGVPVNLVDGGQSVATATTAADGSYQFDATTDGPFDIVAASSTVGVVSVSGVNATPGSPTAVPTLQAGADTLETTVSNGSGPVLGATVVLIPTSGPGTVTAVSATTDSSGDATLDNLTAGPYTMTVTDGTDAAASQAVTVSSTPQDVPVTLGEGGSIAGTITDSGAAPIAGAVVVAVDSAHVADGSATTAANGSYQISGLASGPYSLSISEPSHVPTVLSGVSVSPGGTAAGSTGLASTGSTLTLTLSAAGGSTVLPSVQVGVEDSTGTTVQTVELGPARNSADLSDSGTANLAPGPYTLVVSQPGAAPTTQLVTLASGGSTVPVTAPATEALPDLPAADFTPAVAPVADSEVVGALAHAALAHTAIIALDAPAPPTVSATQLVKAWLGLGGQTLTRLPDDNDALAARLAADQSITIDPTCTGAGSVTAQQSVLKIYADQKDSAFQDWIDQNNVYLHNLAIDTGEISVRLAQAAADFASVAAAFPAKMGLALGKVGLTLTQSGSDITALASQLTTNVGSLAPSLYSFLFDPSQTNTDALLNGLASGAATAAILLAKTGVGGVVSSAFSGIVNSYNDIRGIGMLIQSEMASVKALKGGLDNAQQIYQRRINDLKNQLDTFESSIAQLVCPPPPPPHPVVIVPILIHTPGDPNGIVGPTGYSSPGPQWLAGQSALPYIVNFQNEPTASASATQVVVTEPVPADIDPNSVQLTGFGFGASTSVNIPAGQQSFSQQFTNLNLPNGDYLDVSGVYDPQAAGGANGVITWTFSTIDPSTGDLDSAVNAGFLPPDDAAGDGEGFVSWTGSAKSGLTTGTTIAGQASIVFDRNAAIPTPVWTNTIDATAPTASVTPLPATSPSGNLNVSWSGNDGTGSGVASYDVYESTDGGPLTEILPETTLTSTQVPIVAGHSYGFAVDALDNVGNQGTAPTAVQTDTEAVAPPGATTTSLNLSSPSVIFGAEGSEIFTGTVTGEPGNGYPEGTVTVQSGATPLCSEILPAGSGDSAGYSCSPTSGSVLAASATAYPITATFAPGTTSSSISTSSYTTSTSTSTPAQNLTVNASTSTVSTTTSLNAVTSPLTYGAETAETFKGTVTGHSGDGYPEGTVTLYDGSTPVELCAETLPIGSGDSAGYTCSLTASQLDAGSYSDVDAVFSPAGTSSSNSAFVYTTSTSTPAQSFTVKAASASTTTTLNLSSLSLTFGSETSEAFSGTVTGHGGDGYPEGTVTVQSGATTLCSEILPAGSGDSAGYSCSPSNGSVLASSATPYPITATFTPGPTSSSSIDFTYTTSTSSPAQSLTVNSSSSATPTTTTLNAVISPITYGAENAEIFSGKVTGQSGDGYPKGTVTVKNGTTTLCSETLPSGSGVSASYSCALTAMQLAVGTYSSVDAVFSPAATSSSSSTVTYTTSTSTPVKNVTVNRGTKSTTTTLHPVTSPITVGAETAETFSGTVTGQSGDGYPEGTVTVKNGTTTLCSETVPAGSGDSTTYSCSLTASQLSAGTYSSVDAVFTPGTSSSSNADFSYTGSASTPVQSLTVKPSTTPSNNLQIQMSSPGLVSGVGGLYLLTVTNHASTASTGTLTVVDALPAGLSYNRVLPDPQGWHCTSSSGTVTCASSAAIPAHGADYLLLAVNVSARVGTSITNKVTLAPVGTPASNYSATLTTRVSAR